MYNVFLHFETEASCPRTQNINHREARTQSSGPSPQPDNVHTSCMIIPAVSLPRRVVVAAVWELFFPGAEKPKIVKT